MAEGNASEALAHAVCEALKFGGPETLSNPQGLYGMLTDLADLTSPEMRVLRGVLQESQDKRFLEPLAGLSGSSSARDVEVARLRMTHWLTDERLLAEGVSVSCAQGLAEGTARYLGIALPVAEPAPKHQPAPNAKPAPQAQPAKKAEPAPRTAPAPKPKPQPAQAAAPKPQQTPAPRQVQTPQPQPAATPAQQPVAKPASGSKGPGETAAIVVATLLFFGTFAVLGWADANGVLDSFDAQGIPRWIPLVGLMLVEVGLAYVLDGTHVAAGCLGTAYAILTGWTVSALASFEVFHKLLGWSDTVAFVLGMFVIPAIVIFAIAGMGSKDQTPKS